VELVFPDDPLVSAYQVGAANTLDLAWAGTTAMFNVPNPGTYRSQYIRKKQWGLTQYHNRGISRSLHDPEDFWSLAPATMPHDKDVAFIRASAVDHSGVVLPEGPVFVVPPPGVLSASGSVLTLQGTAPNVAATATGIPPAGAMHVCLPINIKQSLIVNKGASSIWLSFNEGLPEIEIATWTSRNFFSNEFYIRSTAVGGLAFDMGLVIGTGQSS